MVSSSSATKDEVVLQVDSTVQAFLDQLGLPLVHPSKNNNNYTASAVTEDGEDFFVVPPHLRGVGEGVFELPSTTAAAAAAAASIIADGHQQNLPTPHIGPMSPLEIHDISRYEILLTLAKMGAPIIAMENSGYDYLFASRGCCCENTKIYHHQECLLLFLKFLNTYEQNNNELLFHRSNNNACLK